uniref:ATP-synt_DE_N domain-containing protein n=1 Tax=Rhabditophanes sp. KR3021 TaxID=114890 RepID=A0AC35TMC4_9BILA
MSFLARAIRQAPRLASFTQRYASAAAAEHSVNELKFTLASPDTAFFDNALVRQVDVPTIAGMVGVLASHVPTLGVLKPGVLKVTDTEGQITELFVSSGTLSMNIDGTCQVLGEAIIKVADIDESAARKVLESAQKRSLEGSDKDRAEAHIEIEVAEALIKAVTGAH